MSSSSTNVKQSLAGPNGLRIDLVDGFVTGLTDDQANRNVYCVDAAGNLVWQIPVLQFGPYERSPYVSIRFDASGVLKAYRSDGMEYGIDVGSGQVISKQYFK